MPKVEPFTPSKQVDDAMREALQPLTEEQRSKVLDAISYLCAEVSVYEHKLMFETLRQEWSRVFQTMLAMMPEPKT